MNKRKWIENFSSSLGQPEERVCKLLGISLDIIQSEEGKKKRNGSPSPKVQGIKWAIAVPLEWLLHHHFKMAQFL